MQHNAINVDNDDEIRVFDRPEPHQAGFAITIINNTVRSTHHIVSNFRYRATARATSTAISGIASALSMMTLLQIFPAIFPAVVIPILDVGTGIMAVSTGIAIMDLTGVKLFINPRLAAKALASAGGAYVFVFDAMGGIYADISKEAGESNKVIDKSDIANTFNFALFTLVSAAISATHALVKYKNEKIRLEIEAGRAEGMAEEVLPHIPARYMALENATNSLILASTMHAFAANIIEANIENKLNETPWLQLLRYSLSLLSGVVVSGLNLLFQDKPARYINEFMGYLSSMDITTTFTLMLMNNMVAGEELSEVQQMIFMTSWPTMVAAPFLFELSRVFYNEVYSQREHAGYADIESADIESDVSRFSDVEDEAELDNDAPAVVAPAAVRVAPHASFYTNIATLSTNAGDLHTMERRPRG